jgi:ribosomal protein S18 acetylase RimI-like enzyme
MVWQLAEKETGLAGAVLGRAFERDPMFLAALPDPGQRAEMCRALFTANVRHALRYGEVLATGPSPDDIRGVAYWVARPEPEISAAESAELGYPPIEERWGEALAMLGAMEAAAVEPLISLAEPWRYLAGIGVDPAHQGQGHGTALVRRIVADARGAGMRCGLATATAVNARLYERCGFQTINHIPDLGNNLSGWTMLTSLD